MSQKRATEILEEEHHFIQKVVGAVAVLVEKFGGGQGSREKTPTRHCRLHAYLL